MFQVCVSIPPAIIGVYLGMCFGLGSPISFSLSSANLAWVIKKGVISGFVFLVLFQLKEDFINAEITSRTYFVILGIISLTILGSYSYVSYFSAA